MKVTPEGIIKFLSVNVAGLGYVIGVNPIMATGISALGGYYIYKIRTSNSRERYEKSSILSCMEKENEIFNNI